MKTVFIAACGLLSLMAAAWAADSALRPDVLVKLPWTWTAHQAVQPVALTDGSSIAVDGTDANAYTLIVAGNSHTLACPTTIRYGSYGFRIKNSGGATGFAVASCYKFAASPSWTASDGKYDVMTCQAFDLTRLECAQLPDIH